MEEKNFIINEEEKKEIESLLSLDYSEEKSVEILGNVFSNAKRIGYLSGFVCNRLQGSESFIQNADISPLLVIINKLPRIKAKLLWGLLYWKLLLKEDKTEKELILKKLGECKDPYLKIYIIRSFNREDVISRDELKKALNFDEPLELVDFSAEITRDLIDKVFALIKKSDNIHTPFYEKLKDIFSDLNITAPSLNHYEQLNSFLSRLLSFIGFSNYKTLLELFTKYYSVEEQLLVSFDEKRRRNHRDHVLHSLRVFLLGMIFLLIDWEINGIHNPTDLASWVLTSFFHDVGYGIEKLEQTSTAIKNHSSSFGDINPPKFSPKHSFNILRDDTIKKMEEILMQHQNEENHSAHILTPILESLDAEKHGIMSAIMIRKEIDWMMGKDREFRRFFSPLWKKIFLRSALAMTLHTCIEEFSNDFVVDEWKLPRADEIPNLLYPTFLLILIDSIEFINRPKFGSFYSGNNILDYDIDLIIFLNISYDIDNFSNVNIILEYKNQEILIDRFNDFIMKMNNFYSENWGVTITIRAPFEGEGEDYKKITLFLLRSEWKKFEEYVSKNKINLKEINLSEVNNLYNLFFKEISGKSSKNVSKGELQRISDRKTSYQIERSYYKTKRQFW